MEVNHVSHLIRIVFRVIGLTTDNLRSFGYLVSPPMAANRVMRDHRIGSEIRYSSRKFPCRWLGMSRNFASLGAEFIGNWSRICFVGKPEDQSKINLQDMIQTDHDLERAKVINPTEDKKSE